MANQYAIYDSVESGEKNQLIAFAHQKRLAFKEKFQMFTDEARTTVAFEVQARKVIDLGARYDVRDAQGNVLGVIGKDFKASLIRSTWNVFLPNQEEKPFLIVRERSQALAVLRRVWDFIPIVNNIPFFVKYHFDFTDPVANQICATYNKTTILVDRYELSINGGAAEQIDSRVLLSLCVMMDALQSR